MKKLFCACGNPFVLPLEDATFVVASVPCCNRECMRKAEQKLRKETINLGRVPHFDEGD